MTLDDGTLVFAGVVALATLSLFNQWREEPPMFVLYTDLTFGWIAILIAGLTFIPPTEGLIARGVLVILCVTFLWYYTNALITTRQGRRSLRHAQERGLEAQKMEALGRLSGGVAHDFNNILTVVRGNLDLYEELRTEDERDAVVVEAQRAVDRAAALVTQLLTFARRAPLAAQDLELGALISELAIMAKRVLPDSITLSEEPPAGMIYCHLDAAQLNSALLNLIVNARDAMEGRGQISISARLVPGPARGPAELGQPLGRHVRISVVDNDPGMDADTLDKAFEPFYTTKAVGKGSGLGLPMVKGFVEQSGGRIEIETGPDGTNVALHLPALTRAGDL